VLRMSILWCYITLIPNSFAEVRELHDAVAVLCNAVRKAHIVDRSSLNTPVQPLGSTRCGEVMVIVVKSDGNGVRA
jgi:hypothetical protein